jgi:hypothetical protein
MGIRAVTDWCKLALCILLSACILLGLSRLNPVAFPDVGSPTAYYDCDDETLDTYRYFTDLGLEAIPVVGNLQKIGEEFTDSNHVWLMVRLGDELVAYDWGMPRFDIQYYEGFKISLDYLLYVVEQDKKSADLSSIAQKTQ